MKKRVGVWLIGARGSVATTVVYGASALRKGSISQHGLVTAKPPFSQFNLFPVADLYFGGHEIQAGEVLEAADKLCRGNVIPPQVFAGGKEAAQEYQKNIRQGYAPETSSKPPSEVIDELSGDMLAFQKDNQLDRVIVVNLSSTEPYFEIPAAWQTLDGFLAAIRGQEKIPASVIYAFVAIHCGFPFVNFTPSIGNALPAVQELAVQKKVPHCGRDGKTGETLLKTVLAPMFAARNLQVLSWQGYNLLGNGDGSTLANPLNKQTKIQSKDQGLRSILKQEALHSQVSIDYVPSLGDWKTAWDFIHFTGFMGVPMSMQFTWQGCDSALAAPLVLDLIRLADFAQQKGEFGIMQHTAAFFKAPLQVAEHDFFKQMQFLYAYAAKYGNT